MKKIVVAIFLAQLFSFLSCTQKVEDKTKEHLDFNDVQMKYYELVTLHNNALNGKPRKVNKIQQELYIDSVLKAQKAFYEENPIFFNWIGTIKNISMEKKRNTTVIDFEISLKHPYDTIKIKFMCKGRYLSDSLSNYHIYNVIKDLPEYSKVYFTGFLGDEIIPNYLYKDLVSGDIQEPFDIIDLSTNPLVDSYPQKIIEYFNISRILAGKMNEEIHRIKIDKDYEGITNRQSRTYSGYEKECKHYLSQAEEIYSQLSTDEKKTFIMKIDDAFSSVHDRHNALYRD